MENRIHLMSRGDKADSTNIGLQRQAVKIVHVQPVEAAEDVKTRRRMFSLALQKTKSLAISAIHKLKQIRKAVLQHQKDPQSSGGRRLDLDIHRRTALIDSRTKRPYVSNRIRSSRYTFWNFLPRQLVAQSSKLGNFYFFCVSVVQLIPSVSTTGRYTTLVPLLIFVGISMAREGFDDLRRSHLDREENIRLASVFRPSRVTPALEEGGSATTEFWSESTWHDIEVGDVLRIQQDQATPADIVLLNVDGVDGFAYIETMALDGETNLKSRQAPPTLASKYSQSSGLCNVKAHFVVEDPNLDLYKFEGKVSIADKVVPLTNNEVIYRGSILRNTQEVVGMVVFTGEECKMRMNATKNPRIKAPALQVAVNKVVVMIVCFVIGLSLFNTIAYQVWKAKVGKHQFYLSNAGVGFLQLLASYFLMFNPIIPLALYISLEVVKAAQTHHLLNDIELYDEQSNTPVEPRTSTINEELGQVSYIFSDKTGTLTKNLMRLRMISVAGTAWFHDPDRREEATTEVSEHNLLQVQRDRANREKQTASTTYMVSGDSETYTAPSLNGYRPALPGTEFNDDHKQKRYNGYQCRDTKEMLGLIQNGPHTIFAQHVRLFLLAITLCHTCLPTKNTDGEIDFQGISADELALVRAAQDLGYLVLNRTSSNFVIRVSRSGLIPCFVDEVYEILDVIEFSSERKRMSIVICMPDGKICVLCKGADTTLRHRLRLSAITAEGAGKRNSVEAETQGVADDAQVFLERCFQNINDFASEGLRTLLYAYKYVDKVSYTTWHKSYQEGTTSLINRQALIEEAGEQLEQDFGLLGATGIEDRLQDGVLETIDKLHRANIKIWLLTGDKGETAVCVGHACGLIKSSSTMIFLEHKLGPIGQSITTAITNIKAGLSAHSVVVIDGQTLSTIEAQHAERGLFLDLIILVDSVICCRASPGQKASLVKSVRKRIPHAITLAVGDGANDIAMIQEAHVGIGITGQEGVQAARASDYSIAQFRFLQRLLLVHGHWNYIRTCKYVLGTFWKEMMFYLTQALFQRWNGYTGTSLYEPWSLTLFQPLFTSAPVVFMGIFEKDLGDSTLLAVPELYALGQQNGGFNIKIYLWWTFMAASDAVIVFFTMLGLYGEAATTKDDGIYAAGALTFTACIIIISVKMQALELHNKTSTAVGAVLFSLGAWFIWMLAISALYTDNTIYNVKGGLLVQFGRDATWWLTLIATVCAVIVYEVVLSGLRRMFWPTDVDVLQEYEQDAVLQNGTNKLLRGSCRFVRAQ